MFVVIPLFLHLKKFPHLSSSQFNDTVTFRWPRVVLYVSFFTWAGTRLTTGSVSRTICIFRFYPAVTLFPLHCLYWDIQFGFHAIKATEDWKHFLQIIFLTSPSPKAYICGFCWRYRSFLNVVQRIYFCQVQTYLIRCKRTWLSSAIKCVKQQLSGFD